MGANISTPGFQMDDHGLGFVPEISEKILQYLSFEDKLACRMVSSIWNNFIITSNFKPNVSYVVEGTKDSLGLLQSSSLSGPWTQFSFKDIQLHGISTMSLWSNYAETITRLDFNKCFFFPIGSLPPEGSEICPNLRHLSLVDCGEYFRMGPSAFFLDKLFCFENLESLDMSRNQGHLSDRILLVILLRTKVLRALNLSSCSITFTSAIFNRFYPTLRHGTTWVISDISDCVLTFQLLHLVFLSTARARHLTLLNLDNTNVDSAALESIMDPLSYRWKSISINSCREIKAHALIHFVKSQRMSLEELGIKGNSANSADLDALLCHPYNLRKLVISDTNFASLKSFPESLPELTHLDIRGTSVRLYREEQQKHLADLSGLKVLKLCQLDEHNVRLPKMVANSRLPSILVPVLSVLVNLTELNLEQCGNFVSDSVAQAIIQHLKGLKILNVSGSFVTDIGLAGLLIDSYDDMLFTPKEVEEKRLEFQQWRLDTSGNTGGHSLSSLTSLRVLVLKGCEGLGEATWRFGLNMPLLEALNLSFVQISRSGLGAILKNCRSLTSVQLDNVGSAYNRMLFQDAEIQEGIQALPRLRTILSNVMNLTADGGEVVKRTFPNLTTLKR